MKLTITAAKSETLRVGPHNLYLKPSNDSDAPSRLRTTGLENKSTGRNDVGSQPQGFITISHYLLLTIKESLEIHHT